MVCFVCDVLDKKNQIVIVYEMSPRVLKLGVRYYLCVFQVGSRVKSGNSHEIYLSTYPYVFGSFQIV